MMRVLSTRKLTLPQKELLLGSGLSFIEYDAIKITHLPFEAPLHLERVIFTSTNGAKSFLDQAPKNITVDETFCVGEKTAQILAENGHKLVKTAGNASELGNYIAKNYKNEVFWYFCGSRRRPELLDILNSAKIEVFEVKNYQTDLNLVDFDQFFDGIMFFSPSGVQSYTTSNQIGKSKAFCIGETTAEEAKLHTDNVWVANSTSVESVIAKAVKILRSND